MLGQTGRGPVLTVDGFGAEMAVAGPQGWCAAGALRVGSPVLTFEHGAQPLRAVLPATLSPEAPPAFWPLLVPVGALNNPDPALILPSQRLLVEADPAEDRYGEPFVLVPALALSGWRGIGRVRPAGQRVLRLCFDAPQVVYAARGLLLGCAGCAPDAETGLANLFHPSGPITLTLDEGRDLMARITAAEAGLALGLNRSALDLPRY